MPEIRVELGERSYSIFVGADTLAHLGDKVKELNPSRVAVISNPTVNGLYGARVSDSLKEAGFDAPVILIPDGEGYKELLWAYYLFGELLKRRLDRSSALIALGGGVIGDITGFVASTYMRGIPFIQVPTTLLAQVDSSVGGKTGVNHPLGKNMIGTFYQPGLVWTDISTLRSLPRREFLAGMAEVIKYGVIWDEAFFRFLEDSRDKVLNLDRSALDHIIQRSCEIKAEVVSRDEREGGLRAILNYGHTIGHTLETATGYTTYLHGEAVAIGMIVEARLSSLLGHMDVDEVDRVRSLLVAYGLPSEVPPDVDTERMFSSMLLDKKAVAGQLKFILPEKIGVVKIRDVAGKAGIIESIRAGS
jgi:3-dehydroquinate synthase